MTQKRAVPGRPYPFDELIERLQQQKANAVLNSNNIPLIPQLQHSPQIPPPIAHNLAYPTIAVPTNIKIEPPPLNVSLNQPVYLNSDDEFDTLVEVARRYQPQPLSTYEFRSTKTHHFSMRMRHIVLDALHREDNKTSEPNPPTESTSPKLSKYMKKKKAAAAAAVAAASAAVANANRSTESTPSALPSSEKGKGARKRTVNRRTISEAGTDT